jgi:hypothetical protein
MPEPTDPYPSFLYWLRYLSAFLLFIYGSSKLLAGSSIFRQRSRCGRSDRSPDISLPGSITAIPILTRSFLELVQLAGGAMLLFRKTALLGAAAMLPVMTNIVMINIFFSIATGALCTSTFIFGSMLAILWQHRQALINVFWSDQAGEPANVKATRYHRIAAALVPLLAFTLMGVASWLTAGARISK